MALKIIHLRTLLCRVVSLWVKLFSDHIVIYINLIELFSSFQSKCVSDIKIIYCSGNRFTFTTEPCLWKLHTEERDWPLAS